MTVSSYIPRTIKELSLSLVCTTLVILREAEGEVAESNIKEDNPLNWDRGDRRSPGRCCSVHWQTLIALSGSVSPQGERLTRFKINWILQLWAKATACRMTAKKVLNISTPEGQRTIKIG